MILRWVSFHSKSSLRRKIFKEKEKKAKNNEDDVEENAQRRMAIAV